MSNVINMHDYVDPWKELASFDNGDTTLQVFQNAVSGELELVQVNGEGEAIRTELSPVDAKLLAAVLSNRQV